MFLYKQVPAERLSGLSGDGRRPMAAQRMAVHEELGKRADYL